jgi:hypothetical protein
MTNNDHAPALQDGSVAADHSKEQVEVQQWAGSLELGGASTAGRRGQRPDCHEIGARTDAIGRRCVDGPGDGEGCVRGSILDVTLTWATKVSTLALVGETMTLPTPWPRHGRQRALRARRIGLGLRG